ncbi:unnamed protein product [Lactuca saligna]|uniref:START domain-containing protein n=1 Tax=Lactuca saligna TaxID=75948 RepID=A0AA35ZJ50_LACSI|nr:unnamed protein product [Lactuca saligna]
MTILIVNPGTISWKLFQAMIKIPVNMPIKRNATIAILSFKSRKWKRELFFYPNLEYLIFVGFTLMGVVRTQLRFFKEYPHLDDKQRKELGRRLSLEPLQAQHERFDNSKLRNENEKLQAENVRYKEALANAMCPNCGGPTANGEMYFDEQQLKIENARLREEIDRISGIAAKYIGKPMLSNPDASSQGPLRSLELPVASFSPQQGIVGEMFGENDLLQSLAGPTETEKPIIIDLAVTAMEELVRKAQVCEPLWVPTSNNSHEILSEDEYVRSFPRGIGPKLMGFKSEASRESMVVSMNHMTVVEILMDVHQWSNVFSGIVSRAMTLEVLSTGVAGNYNGALQVVRNKSSNVLWIYCNNSIDSRYF